VLRKLLRVVKVLTMLGVVSAVASNVSRFRQGAMTTVRTGTPSSADTWPEVPRRP
jgi:hypothetical protein